MRGSLFLGDTTKWPTKFQEYKYMVGLARAKLVQRQLKSTGLRKGMHVNLNSHSLRGLFGALLRSFPSPAAVALLFPGYQLI